MIKPRIVVVGSSNTDMIVKVDRIPSPGETVLGGHFMTAPGGKGANQAVAAARAGASVTLVAKLGEDAFGEQALAGFRRDGIDVSHVITDPKSASGVALIYVDKQGENSIAVASGANARLTPAEVRRAAKSMEQAKVVLFQLETPLETVEAGAAAARKAGAKVLLNPAPACALPPSLLKQVDILTPNESEAELLTGVSVWSAASARLAARRLLEAGVATVIITMGARGALVATHCEETLVPGFKVKAVDSTAAGDIFNGALATALAEGRSLVDAARFANGAAAISVTRSGAQPSAPYREEIEKLVRG
jgi:ribokinase